MVPFWVWAIVTAAGLALLAVWPAYRRWWRGAVERVVLGSARRRALALLADVCIGSIAVMWTVGGVVGMLSR